MIDHELIKRALAEDQGDGDDITSIATVSGTERVVADFVARNSGVIAGSGMAKATLEAVGLSDISLLVQDGAHVEAGQVLMTVRGDTRAILLAERTALNFFGHLSGIATLTAKWVTQLEGTQCKVRDTRKTTPGYRLLEKYAVRMGGGQNHRMGLWDAAMIKDNHVLVAGGVAEAVGRALAAGVREVICEVDRIDQIEPALQAGATRLLLDNMGPDMLRQAVAVIDGRVKCEASGGVRLETVAAIAATGVDYVSAGRLTQSAPAADIGLDFTPL